MRPGDASTCARVYQNEEPETGIAVPTYLCPMSASSRTSFVVSGLAQYTFFRKASRADDMPLIEGTVEAMAERNERLGGSGALLPGRVGSRKTRGTD